MDNNLVLLNKFITFELIKCDIMKLKFFILTFLTLLCSIFYGQTKEESDMVNLVNEVRLNPKSFIPYIKEYIKKLEVEKYHGLPKNRILSIKPDNQYEDKINEANKLISFLSTQKSLNSLVLSQDMYLLTKNKVSNMDNIIHKETNSVGENVCKIDGSYMDAFIALLIDYNVANKKHRDNIFNKNWKYISIAKNGNIWIQNFS